MLTVRALNRTLLRRQQLLERTSMPTLDLVRHLIGLQGQDSLPPYLALAARLDPFDPAELSGAIERGEAVRLLTMRGTVHVLAAEDALVLRPWVQPVLDRISGANQTNREARGVPVPDLVAATRRILDDGPVTAKGLGERLAEEFPGVPARALAQRAREHVPLVQLPPRGLWRRSGGLVYQTLEHHLGRPMREPDVRELVRRYLRAFGPATPADMSAWSGVTKLGPVFEAVREELVEVPGADGRTRFDLPGAPYGDSDEPAPVRMLGTYDNVWLSHADRSLITTPEARARWLGSSGGVASVVLVDGFIGGLWRWRNEDVQLELFAPLTTGQRDELDEEVERVRGMLRG
ncbi:winged helix DNA-binding domain-containing protein [Naasia sp. SYSU D00948]|uniref:winged helix DNA-binding domain-containing protein n=1 Tax=Naasia sp. SYSU D00948 TaxID=2817379 RepID=UPI001B310482|nr:winged helix DNA-binding domain-containing protein [Naasia sp. SYSU D00948]